MPKLTLAMLVCIAGHLSYLESAASQEPAIEEHIVFTSRDLALKANRVKLEGIIPGSGETFYLEAVVGSVNSSLQGLFFKTASFEFDEGADLLPDLPDVDPLSIQVGIANDFSRLLSRNDMGERRLMTISLRYGDRVEHCSNVLISHERKPLARIQIYSTGRIAWTLYKISASCQITSENGPN